MNTLTDFFDTAKDVVTSIPRSIEDANWFSLPKWMRKYDDTRMPHNGEKEKDRRIRQMESGFLKAESRG
jgi:hypothetical protein